MNRDLAARRNLLELRDVASGENGAEYAPCQPQTGAASAVDTPADSPMSALPETALTKRVSRTESMCVICLVPVFEMLPTQDATDVPGRILERTMQYKMVIVKHDNTYYGPFLDYEAETFTSKLEGESEVIPLIVPRRPEEVRGPMKVHLLTDHDYRVHVDGFKVDTHRMLAGVIQEFIFARRDERVLTIREINDAWSGLFRVHRAVESLMHYADRVIADPSAENLEALRKAFWRNRDADDVDPHYADRFW